jgi:hypothetical protein
MTNKEKIDMIDLWISELKGIRVLCIAQGGIDKISQLKIERINREIKELLGEK